MLTLVFKFSSVKKFSFKKHQFFAKTRDFLQNIAHISKLAAKRGLFLCAEKRTLVIYRCANFPEKIRRFIKNMANLL